MTGESVVYPNVELSDDVRVGSWSLLGAAHRRLSVDHKHHDPGIDQLERVTIGSRTVIGHHVTVYEGVVVGNDCFIDDYVRVGSRTTIGSGTMLLYGVKIYDLVEIGSDCRIAGFVPTRVRMGDRVTMMGSIAHKYNRPLDWSRDEPSAVLEDDVIVGIGATIVGGITVGRGSYVAAGAILTKSIPPGSVVLNTNEIMTEVQFEERKRIQAEVVQAPLR
ncbi:DapH/DapD/GlmU-related protein [Micromonospora chokoriensis]|uniref:Serine O-acetyltransferase n=1 Tax=Micromonospora chokoriensis TaxID=356851 RepID=A0A1C4XMF3_9ACTN|nr:DapH/DapD/GlmU-related protein [Micromonospora chokoriensis]SCF09665.1 serine O-acetyltransferase [Micromonospora chokoriensis]